MELLQNCFEGVEYVELLNMGEGPVEDSNGNAANMDHTYSQARRKCRDVTRPPRRLHDIVCAAATTATSAVFAGIVMWQLWLLLRLETESWCDSGGRSDEVEGILRWIGNACRSAFCSYFRLACEVELIVSCTAAALGGCIGLRMSFGTAYFTPWTEMQELRELERLYRERGAGEQLVLHLWRARNVAAFLFEIVVWMWLRYYLDLYLDIQAMRIFWQNGDLNFWWSNLGGIVLGLFWTAVEFYRILRDERDAHGLPSWQVLVVGLSLPLAGCHVTYLAALSLATGTRHRFLFISTLAESILESAVSAFVQTYAVVLSDLTLADKVNLYTSITLSFISIGYAFCSLDKFEGGELLAQLPGLCRQSSSEYWLVFAFRIAEVTSRATSLALFQCVWRPWGIVWVLSADMATMLLLVTVYQFYRGWELGRSGLQMVRSNIIYALPSSICLMSPILEIDSPLAIPPEVYYTFRLVELLGMGFLAGSKLEWSLRTARGIFIDDGMAVLTFLLSTCLMFLLVCILRSGFARRALLEAPADMWQMRPLTVTQRIMRDRILRRESRPRSAWERGQHRLMDRIRTSPQHSSRHHINEEAKAVLSSLRYCQWEARFLGAKISSCLDQALESLAGGLKTAGAAEVKPSRTARTNKPMLSHSSTKRNSHMSMDSVPSKGAKNRAIVRLGALVHLSSETGTLTVKDDGCMLLRYTEDASDQKVVIEPIDDSLWEEPLLSGAPIRLRSLRQGRLLGTQRVTASQSPVASDAESPISPVSPTARLPLVLRSATKEEDQEPEEFGVFLVHEERYTNASRFMDLVQLGPGSLEVESLVPISESRSGWVDSGWRILLVNGKAATREMIDAIFEEARREKSLDAELAFTAVASEEAEDQPTDAALCTASPSEDDEVKFKYTICYEKCGGDMEILYGDKVLLREFSRPLDTGNYPVVGTATSQRASGGRNGARKATVVLPLMGKNVSADAALCVGHNVMPMRFVAELAEVGGRDDPNLYRWAAGEIQRRAQAEAERSSLAEKCRIAVTVAFNARTLRTGVGSLTCSRELHLKTLTLLCDVLRTRREAEVRFRSLEEALAKLQFRGTDESATTLTVAAIFGRLSEEQVVWPGDEVLDAEVDRGGDQDYVYRSPADLRGLLLPGKPEHATKQHLLNETVLISLRSQAFSPSSAGVQQVLIGQADIVSHLIPTWAEILAPAEPDESDAVMAARLHRRRELFRLKCSLVTLLLQRGWELKYDAFADAAVLLHERFTAWTLQVFRRWLKGRDFGISQSLLAVQLDVLTAAWSAVPKTVKEHRPEVLRELFRPDVELQAMHDGAHLLYERWKEEAESETSGVTELPRELQRFIERMRPSYLTDTSSATWLLRAWHAVGHKRKQKGNCETVQRIVQRFTEIYEGIEHYWTDTLADAAITMDHAQVEMEKASKAAEMRVVTVPAASARAELKHILEHVDPESFVLHTELRLAGSSPIPAGLLLVRRGQLFEVFDASIENADVHRRLEEFVPDVGNDLRLLFGGENYQLAQGKCFEAIKHLGGIIRVVTSLEAAFPESLAVERRDLIDKLHRVELRAVTHENKHRIQIQEKEAQEMVRIADLRICFAEDQRKAAEEKLRRMEDDGRVAELARAEAQRRADQVERKLDVAERERDELREGKEAVEAQLRCAQEECYLTECARSDFQLRNIELEKALEITTSEREQLRAAKESTEDQLRSTEVALGVARQTVDGLQQQLQSTERERDELLEERGALQRERADLEQARDALQQESAQRLKELQSARRQLQEVLDANAALRRRGSVDLAERGSAGSGRTAEARTASAQCTEDELLIGDLMPEDNASSVAELGVDRALSIRSTFTHTEEQLPRPSTAEDVTVPRRLTSAMFGSARSTRVSFQQSEGEEEDTAEGERSATVPRVQRLSGSMFASGGSASGPRASDDDAGELMRPTCSMPTRRSRPLSAASGGVDASHSAPASRWASEAMQEEAACSDEDEEALMRSPAAAPVSSSARPTLSIDDEADVAEGEVPMLMPRSPAMPRSHLMPRSPTSAGDLALSRQSSAASGEHRPSPEVSRSTPIGSVPASPDGAGAGISRLLHEAFDEFMEDVEEEEPQLVALPCSTAPGMRSTRDPEALGEDIVEGMRRPAHFMPRSPVSSAQSAGRAMFSRHGSDASAENVEKMSATSSRDRSPMSAAVGGAEALQHHSRPPSRQPSKHSSRQPSPEPAERISRRPSRQASAQEASREDEVPSGHAGSAARGASASSNGSIESLGSDGSQRMPTVGAEGMVPTVVIATASDDGRGSPSLGSAVPRAAPSAGLLAPAAADERRGSPLLGSAVPRAAPSAGLLAPPPPLARKASSSSGFEDVEAGSGTEGSGAQRSWSAAVSAAAASAAASLASAAAAAGDMVGVGSAASAVRLSSDSPDDEGHAADGDVDMAGVGHELEDPEALRRVSAHMSRIQSM